MSTNSNCNPRIVFFIMVLALGITAGSAAGDIFYVKAGAAGATGSSWNEAFGTLQGTISSAQFDVGKGTFKIVIKNAAIGEQANPAVFRLRFGSYWQEVSVDY